MIATAATTIATPIPMPAAAPDEIPGAGTGEAAGEVSPATVVVVLGWLDSVGLEDDVVLAMVVPRVVEVLDVEGDAGVGVKLGDVKVDDDDGVGDGNGVDDVETGGVLAAGGLVEVNEGDGGAGDEDASTRAAGTFATSPTQKRDGLAPTIPSRISSTVAPQVFEHSAIRSTKPCFSQRQPA